ncbi:MAG: response regulator transcription factor [Dongiaceae bacterium]
MRILIIEPLTLVRRGLALVLARLYRDAEIDEAAGLAEARSRLAAGAPYRLVLCEPAGPDRLAELRALKALLPPATPLVVLSQTVEPEPVVAAIELGVQGYIGKAASVDTLGWALSLVLAGETYLPPEAFLDERRRWRTPQRAANGFAPDSPLAGLSARQLEVLGLMIAGQSNKEIARNLGLLESTVKAHLKAIFGRLKASNRTQAAIAARECGWRPAESEPPRPA